MTIESTDITTARVAPMRPTEPAPADYRVEVDSFGVDGPAVGVDRFVAVGLRLQAEGVSGRIPTGADTVRHRLTSGFGWYATGRARHFVARVDGRDVGRCSAMVDGNAPDPGRGLVGMWECEADSEGADAAAQALLELASAWLRREGCTHVVGPIDFSTWFGYRFRDGVGDGRAPLLLEPATADHAIAQWESFGFVRDEGYFSADMPDPAGAVALAAPLIEGLVVAGWSVRQLHLSEWDDLVAQAHAMSIEEFARQPYYTPITLDDFRAMYEPMRGAVDTRFVFTAWTPTNELAGYVFGVRELGDAVRAMAGGGLRAKLRAARAAWRTDTVMIKTLCVAAEHRASGVGLMLAAAVGRAATTTGHTSVCNMLMHATNRSRAMSRVSGGVEFRQYVTLRREL